MLWYLRPMLGSCLATRSSRLEFIAVSESYALCPPTARDTWPLGPRKSRHTLGEKRIQALAEIGAAVAQLDQVLVVDAGEARTHAAHDLFGGPHGERRLRGDLRGQRVGSAHERLGRVA